MTEKELELLEMYRNLDRHEQNIIMGKISELILNKKKDKICFYENVRVRYYPVVFLFIL